MPKELEVVFCDYESEDEIQKIDLKNDRNCNASIISISFVKGKSVIFICFLLILYLSKYWMVLIHYFNMKIS